MRLANILLCKVIQMSLPSLSPVMPLSLFPSLFCGDCLSVWKFVSAAAPGWGLFWEVDKEEWDGWHTSRDTHHHAPCTTKSPTHACTHTHTCLMRGRIIKVQFISQLLTKWTQFTVFKFWKKCLLYKNVLYMPCKKIYSFDSQKCFYTVRLAPVLLYLTCMPASVSYRCFEKVF